MGLFGRFDLFATPDLAFYVSSYYYMCPHTTICVWELVNGCLFGRFDLFATPDLALVALNRGPQPLLQFANLR